MTETTAAGAGQARQQRDAMTGKLVKRGAVTSPVIEAAFRTVGRHLPVAHRLPAGLCRLDQAGDVQLAEGGPVMKTGWYPFARDQTLSYLTVRDLPDRSGVGLGAHAYGDHAERQPPR